MIHSSPGDVFKPRYSNGTVQTYSALGLGKTFRMQAKNLLVVFAMWQIAAAQENCPGVKLAAGLGSLLGDIPISNCAPDLPLLPDLSCGRNEFIGGFPGFECGPRLPSLPYGDCGLPCLPPLPNFGDCYDYPCIGEPLPYLKKKGCGCLAKAKPACLPTKSCGCGLSDCGLNKCCLEEKEDCGVGLKVVPLIKKFPLKKKKLDCYDSVESLPCEFPALVSSVFRGSLYNDGCY